MYISDPIPGGRRDPGGEFHGLFTLGLSSELEPEGVDFQPEGVVRVVS